MKLGLAYIIWYSESTVGIDFLSKSFTHEETVYRLQIWDTAGQEKYKSLVPAYVRDADCAIFAFDISNKNSLKNLDGWIDLYKECAEENSIGIIAGNKVDLLESATS